MPKPTPLNPTHRCRCCLAPLPTPHANGAHNAKRPAGYCDCVCFAAERTLTASALTWWRQNAWRLDLSPTRPIS
jgi:hypothetical protein